MAPLALLLADGRRVRIDDAVVIGRSPIAPAESPNAISVSMSEPTVSKSHAVIGRSTAGVLWILDLHSSNGSEIIDASGGRWAVAPGVRTPVPRGSDLRLGTDVTVIVEWPEEMADDAITIRRLPVADDAATVAQPPPPVAQPPPPVAQPPPPQTFFAGTPTAYLPAPRPPQPAFAHALVSARSPAHSIALVVPRRATRAVAVLAAIELALVFGLLVGSAIDDFDLGSLIRYDAPSLAGPVVGVGLLLWFERAGAQQRAPQGHAGVTYAAQSPHLAPGTPPFGGRL